MRKISHLKALLAQEEHQKFLKTALEADIAKLLFKHGNKADYKVLIEQIAARQAIRKKLPAYYEDFKILFPPKSNLEQSSSEAVAKFRAQKLPGGQLMADLSGGFGVDFHYLMQNYRAGVFVEPNPDLLDLSKENLNRLLANKNLSFWNQTAEAFLNESEDHFDLIYLDPSRRDKSRQRLIEIEDYQPNLYQIIDALLKRSPLIYVKLSPMLSYHKLRSNFPNLAEIWIISERNECKELGALFKAGTKHDLSLKTWDIYPQKVYAYQAEPLTERSTELGEPQSYLYLPNSSILKAGLQDQCARDFKLKKLDPNSNLFTHHELIAEYPGRKFKVISQHKPYDKVLSGKALQIISRNFPDSPAKIQKKLKLRSKGAEDFLIATNVLGRPYFIVASWLFNSSVSHVG